jgi:hypothetical protein
MAETKIHDRLLGTSYAKNILVNGGFEIWQRWTSKADVANNEYGPDQWKMIRGGTITSVGVGRIAADANNVGLYAGDMAISGAGSGAYAYLLQFIEDYPSYKNQTMSLSVRVYCTVSNKLRIGITEGGVGTQYSGYHGGTGWETLTVTKTLGNTLNALAVGIGFWGANEAVDTLIKFDNAMLVMGSQPTQFFPLHPAEDRDRCQRYFETGNFEMHASSRYAAGVTCVMLMSVYFNTPKASGSPTVTLGSTNMNPPGSVGLSEITHQGFEIIGTSSPVTSDRNGYMYGTWNAKVEL